MYLSGQDFKSSGYLGFLAQSSLCTAKLTWLVGPSETEPLWPPTCQPGISFRELTDRLEQHYGVPKAPAIADPFELIIWENIVYLSDDKQRAAAFAELKRSISIEPEKMLKADRRTLPGVTKAGILPDLGVEKLLTVAKIAYEEFGGNLRPV